MALLTSITTLYHNAAGLITAGNVIFAKFKELFSSLFTIIDRLTNLVKTVQSEVIAWKNFKQDIRFKSRVINLEKAVTKTKALITGAVDAWHAILNLTNELKASQQTKPIAEIEAEALSAEEGAGLAALAKVLPRLAKIGTKLIEFVTFAIAILETFSSTIDDVQTIVDELQRIRLEIEKLDTIFLQQDNKRKVIRLADGKSVRIRLGKLHESVP